MGHYMNDSFILILVELVRNGFNVTSRSGTPEGYLHTIGLMVLCFSEPLICCSCNY